jgi:opacity protein-like surface antigen
MKAFLTIAAVAAALIAPLAGAQAQPQGSNEAQGYAQGGGYGYGGAYAYSGRHYRHWR